MSVQTDISSLVDEVFDSMECAWRSGTSHGGVTIAYVDFHGCGEGWICSDHYLELIADLPNVASLIVSGAPCAHCGQRFTTLESWVRVHLL